MDWFHAYSSGILRGSLCAAPDKTQLIWIKMLAMANEAHNPNTGRLEFAKGLPYDLPFIATNFHKTVEDIKDAIEIFKNDVSPDGTPRVIVEEDGTIVLNHWGEFNPDRVKKQQVEKLPIDKEVSGAYAVKEMIKNAVDAAKQINPEVAERTLDEISKPSTKDLREMNRKLKQHKKIGDNNG